MDEPKKYRVQFSDRAKFMLFNHFQFLSNVSVSAARNMREKIYKNCASLEFMPQRCPRYHTIRATGDYRQLIIGIYQVIFSIDEVNDIVNVKYILDSRQNNEF